LSPYFVAFILLMTLVAVALAVTLVVASGVGPHLAHAVASSLHTSSLAVRPYPSGPCPGGLPTC
jgi:hypothetical protein